MAPLSTNLPWLFATLFVVALIVLTIKTHCSKYKYDIPDDCQTADGFAKIIDKYYNHQVLSRSGKIYERVNNFILPQ